MARCAMSLLRLHGDAVARSSMLDFATCLWPGDEPAALGPELERALADRHRYPDDREARAAIAARHGRTPAEILALNGACESFWLLAQAIRPRTAACVHPAFTEPEAALRASGAEVTRVPCDPADDWRLDPDRVPEDVEVVVVGNPNNPTGALSRSDALLALARPGRLLVVDESFIEFAGDDSLSLTARGDVPGLVVVRSLTKLFSLAGLRAGYLVASPELIERLCSQRQPWSVNRLACTALATCATDRDAARRVAAEVAAARAGLFEALRGFESLRVWPSAANFLLLSAPHGEELVDGLRERGIAVRPAASFPGLDGRYIRVAVRPPADNAVLLGALEEVVA
jgi:histidinol-phosphate/aromatic aminotransferase/cobyric acid decarboxylase-like protein